ncbi:MFS transporter [Melghirimyces profundicolus]|uniref:MFS transporter n=1 Tax=Melghirimyces profundicolus TaxID=1242148 RepID=UPI0031832DDB
MMVINAITYLCSALSLTLIQNQEKKPHIPDKQRPFFRNIHEGMNFVVRNPHLRAIAGEAGNYNLFYQVVWTVIFLYMTRELRLGPDSVGIVLSVLSGGAWVGSVTARSLERRFALGPTIVGSMIVGCGSYLLIPLSGMIPVGSLAILLISFFLIGFGVVISNIHVVSLRQAITPPHLMGRANAAYRFAVAGTTPLGALLGGLLGTYFGLQTTLLIGALGTLSALLWLLFKIDGGCHWAVLQRSFQPKTSAVDSGGRHPVLF